jgi:hypothetical protein
MEIQPGRRVRPIKPLLSWELVAGVKLVLPAEIESVLIREGFAEPATSAENELIEGT